jgi:hypothetical protein
VVDADDADAQVRLVSGAWVDRWRAVPEAVEVAHLDPRTAEEQAEYERLHREVRQELLEAGLPDLADRLDADLIGAGSDPRTPPFLSFLIGRMITIGAPIAVFVAPPGVEA